MGIMIAAGVPLPETVVTALGDAGEPCFAFNEIAFAVAPKRLEGAGVISKNIRDMAKGFCVLSKLEMKRISRLKQLIMAL